MSKTNNKKHGKGWLAWYIPLLLVEFGVILAFLLKGKNVAIFNPKGHIAHEQLSLLIYTIIVLFSVAVPTVLFLYFVAWKYRESNEKATYSPQATHGKSFVFTIWGIPVIFMLILLATMYPATHRLEPRKSLASNKEPITIQVISLRWKWVFLYPDQRIATVNFVQIPEDTPIKFELTADEAPMSSFWIPNLGGQLYTMTGHVNTLNLMADTTGDYPGSSAEINGAGFAGMKFTTRVSSAENFKIWADTIHQTNETLDSNAYEKLVEPSEDSSVALYGSYEPGLYDTVVMKYMGSHEHQPAKYEAHH